MWPSSLRARLTIWYTILIGAPLIALAIASYVVFARGLEAGTDRFITDALSAVAREVHAERRVAETSRDALEVTLNEVRFRDLHIVILDSAGPVASSVDGPRSDHETERWRADADRALAARFATMTLDDTVAFTLEGTGERVVAEPLAFEGRRFRIAGVYSLDFNQAVLSRIRRIFLLSIPLLILCAAAGGRFIAGRSLAPVADMASRAAEISARTLHDRLPVSGGAELVKLAQVVNGLLDRIEHSFEEQRRFVADASHELRTPAAIVHTEADVTLSRPHREEREYRESFTIVRDAAGRLARIVDDLFLLARSDAGDVAHRPDHVYLDELVHDVIRGIRSVAQQRGVQVELSEVDDVPVFGDADLLGRLVLNLLDNAIKHSPPGSAIDVKVGRSGGSATVDVIDAGSGIPADVGARVFERFFRADVARSRDEIGFTSGAGLGLAIARRAAEVHRGALDLVESRPGHTHFRFTMPLDSGEPG